MKSSCPGKETGDSLHNLPKVILTSGLAWVKSLCPKPHTIASCVNNGFNSTLGP